MKKTIILFMCLLLVFCGSWVFKNKKPINKKDDTQITENAWFQNTADLDNINNVSDEWILDPEIPENYVPVIGEDELYMVIDDNGKIEKYRQRTKQKDGTWIWKDVNPDIPNGYEPVPGLKDVYRVKENGKYKYYKYIRNDDNTYTFIEVDKDGNIIDEYILAKEATARENNEIPENYVKISGDIYGVKDKNNVTVGYKKMVTDQNGKISWEKANKPSNVSHAADNNKITHTTTSIKNPYSSNQTTNNQNGNSENQALNGYSVTTKRGSNNSTNSKQSTTKEKYRETKEVNGYRITYEYTITKTYDTSGNLISTKKEGPVVVDKQLITGSNNNQTVDKNLIEKNIDNEIVRVSSGMNIQNSIANSVLNSLNAARTSSNIKTLSNSGAAVKLSKLIACDMAKYQCTSASTPTYGSLSDLINRYNIRCNSYGVNAWRTTSSNPQAIHKRLQSLDNCREARMNKNFSYVGETVIEKDGYYYVAEVLIG